MATLNVNNEVLTVFSGSHNLVFNVQTNQCIDLTSTVQENSGFENCIENYLCFTRYCSALSKNGKWYAVAEGRNLSVWSTSNWMLRSKKILERSASKILFMPSDDLIVADKTGDVYLFAIFDNDKPKGTLLLGHLSILLDITVTPDEKFIITCDRDEKVRVTCYPNTYSINSFCLGHTAFVTKVVLLNNRILITSSGDGTMKFWFFTEGKMLLNYSVSKDVKQDQPNSDLELCVINNLTMFDSNINEKILCLSIHNCNGIFVYRCNYNSDIFTQLIQKICCDEFLDIIINDKLLWILNKTSSFTLNVLSWNENDFHFDKTIPYNLKNVIDSFNSICFNIGASCNTIDLTILRKKYILKEKKSKKIKCK